MTFEYIIGGIIGAFICAFVCGGWYLLDCWLDDLSVRRWRKKLHEHQKEDSALTWEDIEEILIIDAELWEEIREQKCLIETKEYYGEVLRRFNEYKSKKEEKV